MPHNTFPHLLPRLRELATALIDQQQARVLVAPQRPASGYWFGGGNVVRDPDGELWICGRYRNAGDSRTGVGAGERGLELALFHSPAVDQPFKKIRSFSKADLACGGRSVVSIEGSSLHFGPQGVELFVSTEKQADYPAAVRAFQKPGTGVWSIDRTAAGSVHELSPDTLHEVIGFGPPERLHVKDPVITPLSDGSTALLYCTHPHSWSSSGTAVRIRPPGGERFDPVSDDVLRRGPVWDIAAARVTERLPVPAIGPFADLPPLSLYFYDSCESLRPMDENPAAVRRPRGYSCEEIGGLAIGLDGQFPKMETLSVLEPLFVSPHGTGCSRYISVLPLEDGLFATWQQSQPDLSQPLVGHFLPRAEVERILIG